MMSNPFITMSHRNPYRWTPFAVVRVDPDDWDVGRVRARITKALKRSQGKHAREIDGVCITEACVSAARSIFGDPNSRLVYELLVHGKHRSSEGRYEEEFARICSLADTPPDIPWKLRIDPKPLNALIPDPGEREIKKLTFIACGQSERRRLSDVTLQYSRKGLR